MDSPITAVIMAGAAGPSAPERMIAAARRLAVLDLCATLSRRVNVERILIAIPAEERQQMSGLGVGLVEWDVDSPAEPFHFGRRLTDLIQRYRLKRVAYFGAGSAPLLTADELASAIAVVAASPARVAVTNNVHSADWVVFSQADSISPIAHWLERDNMLAWRLREEAGFKVASLPASASTRLDIDTPFDLQALALYPHTPSHLNGWLRELAGSLHLDPLRRAVQVLNTPGSRVTLIGRVSGAVWGQLEAKSGLWTRVLSEERGMAANRRQAEGQVFSFIADHIDRIGESEFVAQLARTSEVVFFDTRVYLAHHHSWPSTADRFASDLGQWERIEDARLRRLTQAIANAPIPIIAGGHNVVSGGLYALLDIESARRVEP